MWLKIQPAKILNNEPFYIPSSKPETQRAIFVGSVADGHSRVFNDLRCIETETMKKACRCLGGEIKEHDDYLSIYGRSNVLKKVDDVHIINCIGSGLVARIFSVLSSVSASPVIITGDSTLRKRVMAPLFDNLHSNGVRLDYLGDVKKLPVMNRNRFLPGGVYTIPGDISSQFITAFLLTAPFAEGPMEINVQGEVYSKSYIRQTLAAMQFAGVAVEHSPELNYFKVFPGKYIPCDTHVTGDFTSASYVLAKAALFPGTTILKNMSENSLQGEKAIVDVLRALGLDVRFIEERRELIVENKRDHLTGDVEFNAMDFPNIVPTLASIGAFVTGRFRVVGASITRLHKSSRVDAMVSELRKVGVNIVPLYRQSVLDGFEIRGRHQYEGGASLSSWGDHRIFMSLLVMSLKMRNPNLIEGHLDVDCSFPKFLTEFRNAGAKFDEVENDETTLIPRTESTPGLVSVG